MFQKVSILALTIGLSMAPSLEAQAWRGGGGRLEGTVTNSKGEPIPNAVVALRLNGQGPDLKTDKKGKWAILGLAGGNWSVDVSAPGYQTRKTSVQVSEVLRAPSMVIPLEPEQKAETTSPTISVGGKTITPETAAAIEAGNVAMKAANQAGEASDNCRNAPAPGKESPEAREACAKAAAAERSAHLKEAQRSFSKALPALPDNQQILTNLELAYYLDDNFDEAVKYARQIVAKDPEDATSWMMIAKLELERGNFDAGKEALSHVPEDRLKDPMPFLNMGILYYNKKRPADAEEAFTKAIARRPDMSEAFYYRGLARYQAKNIAGAKADFQKYLQLDPTGKDAATVKDLLKTLK
jgi:cytochrome c-type biogenesis protein CcmH/NrfG